MEKNIEEIIKEIEKKKIELKHALFQNNIYILVPTQKNYDKIMKWANHMGIYWYESPTQNPEEIQEWSSFSDFVIAIEKGVMTYTNLNNLSDYYDIMPFQRFKNLFLNL